MKLANHRLDVAEENAKDGSQAWAFLRLVARYLRQEGMSSDESGTEQRKYIVRIRLWRSKALIPYLDMIDEDFNDTGGVSGRVTGNPGRKRIRQGMVFSTGRALTELLLNFYDDIWYSGLLMRERSLLKARPAVEMPTILPKL